MAITATGTVKFFNTERGFGFFTTAHGIDVFVLQSMLKNFGFDASDMTDGAPAAFEYEIDPKRRKPRTTSISSINGKAALIVAMPQRGRLNARPAFASQRPTNGAVVLEVEDIVFGTISSMKAGGAVLSIVARLRNDGKLASYPPAKRPSLLVPWAMVPVKVQNEFTLEAGFYYKLVVESDQKSQLYGRVLKIATDEDAPPDAKVESVPLMGIGSHGQPIMELGDPILIDVHPAELPAHITDPGGLRTMQLA